MIDEREVREMLQRRADSVPAAPTDAPTAVRRAHRRLAVNGALAAVAAAAIAVSAFTGVDLLRADRIVADQPPPAPSGTVGIALPIEYPVGEELPDLGDAPGPLAAVWMVPRGAGAAPEAVGLVAETGTFGTLPIDVFHDNASRRTNTRGWAPDDPEPPDELRVALSTDGRRLAYFSPAGELVVHDLVSGESSPPLSESNFETRLGATWDDATHLFGYVYPGSDAEGWVWEPGTAPKLVDTYDYAEGFRLWVSNRGSGPLPWPDYDSCVSPSLLDSTGGYGRFIAGWGYTLDVPELCDILGIIDSEILLGHWNSDRMPGDWNDPNDGNGTVVALDIDGVGSSFEDPSLRRVVASAGAPLRVTFAADLIGEALDADGGAS